MADMISVLVIMIFAYFAVKKFAIPRIAAKRAAKREPVTVSVPDGTEGMQAVQAAIKATAGNRPITCFDMRLIPTYVSDDGDDNEGVLTQRITYAASEMLLNASLRGDNVRLSVSDGICGNLMLYVTYTVR